MAASTVSVPAPVGGWNARDSIADMSPMDAVTLTNWFPMTTECVVRGGYTQWATGLPGQVETIMSYAGGSSTDLFCISGNSVYDISAGGAVGAAVLTGLSNSRWQYCNVSTAGGNFLYMANGLDTPYLYNGATWTSITGASAPAITGVTTTLLNSPILFKNRVFFIEQGSLKTWYLPTLSVGGAAASVDVSSFAGQGGYIVAHGTWTIDAGKGVDDHYVMVTSKGQVIVYAGTDPSSANTWAMVGIWDVGAPVGHRCLYKYAGDLLLISQDGILPLSAALQSSRVNPKVALTDKIQSAVSQAVSAYGGNFGWELLYFARENQLYLNVPVSQGGQAQYVMNSISKSWCDFSGIAANCFELFDDNPYFGSNGYVGKLYDSLSDNSTAISATALQAFSHFKSPSQVKRFTMSRPIFRADSTPSIGSTIKYDFDLDVSTAPLSISTVTASTWDASTWGLGLWGGGLSVYKQWQGANGVGYYAAPMVQASNIGTDLRWVATDLVYEKGTVL